MVDYRVEHISEDERKACFGVSEQMHLHSKKRYLLLGEVNCLNNPRESVNGTLKYIYGEERLPSEKQACQREQQGLEKQ